MRRFVVLMIAISWLLVNLADSAWTAPKDWDSETVDVTGADPNDVGDLGTSLALDGSNNPHISYYDRTNGDLKYAVWDTSTTPPTWNIEVVDNTGSVGKYSSLALDASDNPHISYYDETNGDLKYAVKSGGAWSTETADSTGNVGLWTSLEIESNGTPHISYYDETNFCLKHAVKSGSWSVETVDSSGDVGKYSSLELDSSNNPHISYYEEDNNNLKYAVKNVAWSTETVDSSGDVGKYSSLELDGSNNPHIGYYDDSGGDLKYAVKNVYWTKETVDSAVVVGRWTSLALESDGTPHLSYYDATNGDLKYATKNGSWNSQTVDVTDNVGRWTSLALEVSGSNVIPHISYYDATNGDLKHAKLAGGGGLFVELGSFTAVGSNGEIKLAWETGSEVSSASFNVLRSETSNGEYVRINYATIPALGNAFTGADYSYSDFDVLNGATYYYALQEVEFDGDTNLYGPVSGVPGIISLLAPASAGVVSPSDLKFELDVNSDIKRMVLYISTSETLKGRRTMRIKIKWGARKSQKQVQTVVNLGRRAQRRLARLAAKNRGTLYCGVLGRIPGEKKMKLLSNVNQFSIRS